MAVISLIDFLVIIFPHLLLIVKLNVFNYSNIV